MISHSAPARVGILGNPSDGYGGRTLGLSVDQFRATVSLDAQASTVSLDATNSGIRIVAAEHDEPSWSSIGSLVENVDRYGYATAVPLIVATIRTFVDLVSPEVAGELGGFSISYSTTIPRQVGLAGSSALVVATLRCLCEFGDLAVPDEVLASVALAVETEQLGITAGLQDRVIQVFGGLVAMDFGEMSTNARFGVAHGVYERLDPATLPPLFLAYRASAAEPSGNYHAALRSRFDAGEGLVRETMKSLAGLVAEGRAALRWGATDRFGELVGQNMSLRRRLGPLPEAQLALVDVAADLDAPATFTGSGGAVVGVYADASHLDGLRESYARLDAEIVDLRYQG